MASLYWFILPDSFVYTTSFGLEHRVWELSRSHGAGTSIPSYQNNARNKRRNPWDGDMFPLDGLGSKCLGIIPKSRKI